MRIATSENPADVFFGAVPRSGRQPRTQFRRHQLLIPVAIPAALSRVANRRSSVFADTAARSPLVLVQMLPAQNS